MSALLAPSPPLCLPSELLAGDWTLPPTSRYIEAKHMRPRFFIRSTVNASATWRPHADCSAPESREPAKRLLQQLARRNVTFVFSGNSVVRHIFFRLAAYLRGIQKDEYSTSERDREKAVCSKELSPSAGGDAGKFKKPFCKTGCCGVCSCAHEVDSGADGSVRLYFVWQQEWYDARMRRVWDALLTSAPFERRTTYMVMNAGLVNARKDSLSCIIDYQFPILRDYLIWRMPGVNCSHSGGAMPDVSKKSAERNCEPQSFTPKRRPRKLASICSDG